MDDVEMQNDDWVLITSNDGHAFMVRRKVAITSGTLRNMLDENSSFAEAITNTCPIMERAAVVERLCEYMAFRSSYENAGAKEEIPVQEFQDRIPPEVALELLLAADYLEGECNTGYDEQN